MKNFFAFKFIFSTLLMCMGNMSKAEPRFSIENLTNYDSEKRECPVLNASHCINGYLSQTCPGMALSCGEGAYCEYSGGNRNSEQAVCCPAPPATGKCSDAVQIPCAKEFKAYRDCPWRDDSQEENAYASCLREAGYDVDLTNGLYYPPIGWVPPDGGFTKISR